MNGPRSARSVERSAPENTPRAGHARQFAGADPYFEWASLTNFAYLHCGDTGPVRVVRVADDLQVERTDWLPSAQEFLALDPRAQQRLLLAAPGMREWGEPVSAIARRPSSNVGPPVAPAATVPTAASAEPRRVLGVIDGRCAFANTSFLRRGPKPRICSYWDQSQEAKGDFWRPPPDRTYGRELDAEALVRAMTHVLQKTPVPPASAAAAEAALYALLEFEQPLDADWSHGTHMLETMLAEHDAQVERLAGSSKEAAPEPDIVFVQLPDVALRDTGARWTAAYVLDALDYILARTGAADTIVVNLSLGAFAGPHDGSSALERAIDERIARFGGRLSVVAAAGNAGGVRDDGSGEERVVRWEATLASGGDASVLIDVDFPDRTETLAELWVERSSQVVVALGHVGSGGSTGAVGPGETGALRVNEGGRALAAVIHTGEQGCPNGDRALVLVAIGHTQDRSGAPCAPLGPWRLTLHNAGAEAAQARLWLERRDVPGELPGYRPQYGLREELAASGGSKDVIAPQRAGPERDLGSLAGGKRTIVVSAHPVKKLDVVDDARPVHDEAKYAAEDKARQRGIDVTAAGRRRGTGFLTGAKKDLRGTSVAAARVSGLLLAAGASADPELGAMLAACDSRSRQGRHARGALGAYGPVRAPLRSEAPLP